MLGGQGTLPSVQKQSSLYRTGENMRTQSGFHYVPSQCLETIAVCHVSNARPHKKTGHI